MGALTPGPEDAEEQDNGADDRASTTHSRRLSLRASWYEVVPSTHQSVPTEHSSPAITPTMFMIMGLLSLSRHQSHDHERSLARFAGEAEQIDVRCPPASVWPERRSGAADQNLTPCA